MNKLRDFKMIIQIVLIIVLLLNVYAKRDENMILYTSQNHIGVYNKETKSQFLVETSSQPRFPQYDNTKEFLFWVEENVLPELGIAQSVFKSCLSGCDKQTLASFVCIDDMKIDYVTLTLYVVSCDGSYSIYACHFKGLTMCRAIVESHVLPNTSLVLDPDKGMMYWINNGGLWRSGMDGSNIRALSTTNLKNPTALYLSYHPQESNPGLFFANKGQVENYDFVTGTRRTMLEIGDKIVTSILVSNSPEDEFYLTFKDSKAVTVCKKPECQMDEFLFDESSSINHLNYYFYDEQKNNPCLFQGCHQFCFLIPGMSTDNPCSSRSVICACMLGFYLDPFGKRQCLEGSKRLFPFVPPITIIHEEPQRRCSKPEFSCKTGKCIPKSKLCDGNDDCGNGEDEIITACRINGKPDIRIWFEYEMLRRSRKNKQALRALAQSLSNIEQMLFGIARDLKQGGIKTEM